MASSLSGRETIVNIGTGTQYERAADAAITPGQLVELLSTDKIQKQATALADIGRLVAIENFLIGEGINDAYAVNDIVLHRAFGRGDQILLILKDGNGPVAIGDKLEAALLGEVQKFTTGVKLFECVEAQDASGGGVALDARRILVRVI